MVNISRKSVTKQKWNNRKKCEVEKLNEKITLSEIERKSKMFWNN
jgi:hypothetical protein